MVHIVTNMYIVITIQVVCKDKLKTGVFVKHECPRRQQSPKLAIFLIQVTVKATRSPLCHLKGFH